MGKCEHGLRSRECFVCASPKHGAQPGMAEQLLASQGVFKGAEGLRGLAESDEFWQRQQYGTRLYYEDGSNNYLHRDVLRAAVRALDASAPQEAPAPSAREVTQEEDRWLRKALLRGSKVVSTGALAAAPSAPTSQPASVAPPERWGYGSADCPDILQPVPDGPWVYWHDVEHLFSSAPVAPAAPARADFAERCRIAQECLPDAEYRRMLTALHDDMLAALSAGYALTDEDRRDMRAAAIVFSSGRYADNPQAQRIAATLKRLGGVKDSLADSSARAIDSAISAEGASTND